MSSRQGHAHQLLGGVAHRPAVHVGVENTELVEAVDDPVHVLPHRREHGAHHAGPGLTAHLEHHPEVEQHEPAAGVHQQVAGMRIGVKEAVLQHHLDVDLGDEPEQIGQHHPAAGDAILQPIDAGALDVLQDDHSPPGQLGDDLGNDHARIRGEVAPQGLRIARLLPEIELTPDALGELAHDRRDRAGMVVGKQEVQNEEAAGTRCRDPCGRPRPPAAGAP